MAYTMDDVRVLDVTLRTAGKELSANQIIRCLGGSKRDALRTLRAYRGVPTLRQAPPPAPVAVVEEAPPAPPAPAPSPAPPVSAGQFGVLRQEFWRLSQLAQGQAPESAAVRTMERLRGQFGEQRAVAVQALERARRLHRVVELARSRAIQQSTGRPDAAANIAALQAGQSPQQTLYDLALAQVIAWCGASQAQALVAMPGGDPGWTLA
jgi:hypothetical protein